MILVITLGCRRAAQLLRHLGVIKWGKDSRAVMGAVGTCGRYRRRQAFMNTGSTFMWEICGKTFTIDLKRRRNKSRSWRRKQLINKAAE